MGRRLDNFFWRIWGSHRIRDRLSRVQIETQYDIIKEGGYIRTTPTASPRSSMSFENHTQAARADELSASPVTHPSAPSGEPGPFPGAEDIEDASITPTPKSPFANITQSKQRSKENRQTATARPPPILKKLSSGSSRSSKSAVVASSVQGGGPSDTATTHREKAAHHDQLSSDQSFLTSRKPDPVRRSAMTRFNEEVAVSIPKASASVTRNSGEKSSRSQTARRNPIVVASTGIGKRRPTVMRKGSSQASLFGTPRTSSYPNLAKTPKPTSTGSEGKPPTQEVEISAARSSRAASAHLFKQPRRKYPDHPFSEEVSDVSNDEDAESQKPINKDDMRAKSVEDLDGDGAHSAEEPEPLVDQDFRSQRSFTNLPSLARKSSAAVPTAASFQASGTLDAGPSTSSAGRGKGRDAFKNEIVPLKAPAAAGPDPADEDSQHLPRTKSQLTLLLEREKNRATN